MRSAEPLVVLALALAAAAGCREKPAPAPELTSALAPRDAGAAPGDASATSFPDAAPQDTGASIAVPPPKVYRKVVHTGDSMVGGGLCKALAPKFKAEGTRFVRDVWESASILEFDESDRMQTLMKKHDPDLVLITLGANDVFNKHPEFLAKHIASIAKKVGHRDCVWIGPPLWKGDAGLVEVLRTSSAPCRFYDSQGLVLARAGDHIHPTDKGGEVWADAFWDYFKSDAEGRSAARAP